MRLLLIVLCFLSLGMGQVPTTNTTVPVTPAASECSPCTDQTTDKSTGQGFSEHYAFQNMDGSINYIVQDRTYFKCLVQIDKSTSISKAQWDATISDYHYQPTP